MRAFTFAAALTLALAGTAQAQTNVIFVPSLAFGTTLAVVGYWIGQFIGRYLAVWPIGRFLKQV